MSHRDVAEAGWAWTLTAVRRDPDQLEGAGIHSGLGGLGLALAEVRRTRPWSDDEAALADEVAAAVRADVATATDASWFDGLPGHVEVLLALGATGAGGADRAVTRLLDLATPTGWPTTVVGPPRHAEDARINDVTLGTAAVLRAAVAAHAHGTPRAEELAVRAAEVLLAEVEAEDDGPTWPFVPHRFRADRGREMPNWSHGAAGVAHALADAGVALARPEWVELARRAAARLVAVADHSRGMRVPHLLPRDPEFPEFSLGWCHGPSGTAQVFTALEAAGVDEVAGESPGHWHERCWYAVRSSGIPARLEPGFWDNDGRCCGTAGVGDLALDAGLTDFAVVLGDALVERAIADGDGACWRFVEHRAEDQLLPPAVGWMQGSAGIAAFLFRLAREVPAPRR